MLYALYMTYGEGQGIIHPLFLHGPCQALRCPELPSCVVVSSNLPLVCAALN